MDSNVKEKMDSITAKILSHYEVLYRIVTNPENKGQTDLEQPETLALHAVAIALGNKEMPPEWAAREFVAAMNSFQSFEHKSLGDAFKIKENGNPRANKIKQMRGFIAFEVDQAVLAGAKTRSNRSKNTTAFEIVGKKLLMSADSVSGHYYAWKRMIKSHGVDYDSLTKSVHESYEIEEKLKEKKKNIEAFIASQNEG